MIKLLLLGCVFSGCSLGYKGKIITDDLHITLDPFGTLQQKEDVSKTETITTKTEVN